MITTLLVENLQDVGMRLDHYLVYNLIKYSRSHIQSFIRSGDIRVNGKKVKTGYSLELKDLIHIEMPGDESITKKLIPENLDLNIIYEDECIIVINKPAGLIVHPGVGAKNGTLAHGLAYHFKNLSDINGDFRPGIVHRLDKETSGVMIVAKTNEAHSFLADEFKTRKVKKKYIGLTWGHWKDEEGEIDQSLSRDKKDHTKYRINVNGKRSITRYKVRKQLRHCSLVSFYPLTGRTHQIRIHSAHYGHPIFGDEKYGGGSSRAKGFLPEFKSAYKKEISRFDRHALHAQKLELIHPTNKEIIIFEAPLPVEYLNLIDAIDLINE